MTCPNHDEPLAICPNSGDLYCRECQQEQASEAYYAYVDEMYASLGIEEKIDHHTITPDPPF